MRPEPRCAPSGSRPWPRVTRALLVALALALCAIAVLVVMLRAAFREPPSSRAPGTVSVLVVALRGLGPFAAPGAFGARPARTARGGVLPMVGTLLAAVALHAVLSSRAARRSSPA